MKKYVKVENGSIVQGPTNLSDSPTASPNSSWTLEQLWLNGYFVVDLTHDEMVETIDYENPVIEPKSVTYPKKSLSQSEKDAKFNALQKTRRMAEYPSYAERVEAIWSSIANSDDTLLNEVKDKINAVNEKYPLI